MSDNWIEIRNKDGEPECVFSSSAVSHAMKRDPQGTTVVMTNGERLALHNIPLEAAIRMLRGESV